MADLVADTLRYEIMAGRLPDGSILPKQEDLLDRFGVSKPSLREALRILETEGLVTVRRGTLGGAVVHAPRAEDAAYMIGLVLQSRSVALDDVGAALLQIEPLCAALCAERKDRQEAVLPPLHDLHGRLARSVDDDLAFTELSRQFHETVVRCCGNQTMIVIVGALESIWSVRQQAWAQRVTGTTEFPPRDVRQSGIRAHQRLLELIEKGDAPAVTRVARAHLEAIQRYTAADPGVPVVAAALRATGPRSRVTGYGPAPG